MPVLEDLRSLLRRRRETRTHDLHGLARQAARGESPDPDEILAACSAAGIDDDHFTTLVELIARRDELRQRAADAPALERELATLRNSIAVQRAALDEAQSRYRRAVEPLLREEESTTERLRQAVAAGSELLADRNLPVEIAQRLETARRAYLAASARVTELESMIEREERLAADAVAKLDAHPGGVEKARRMFADPATRLLLSAEREQLVRQADGGRHRADEGCKQLPALVKARDDAHSIFEAAQTEARNF